MNEKMEVDHDRLEALLEAYGADPERWPAAERDQAVALLASSAEARALQREAATLDRMLDLAAPPAPSPELMADILAGASVSPWRRWAAMLWPFGPIWKFSTRTPWCEERIMNEPIKLEVKTPDNTFH